MIFYPHDICYYKVISEEEDMDLVQEDVNKISAEISKMKLHLNANEM